MYCVLKQGSCLPAIIFLENSILCTEIQWPLLQVCSVHWSLGERTNWLSKCNTLQSKIKSQSPIKEFICKISSKIWQSTNLISVVHWQSNSPSPSEIVDLKFCLLIRPFWHCIQNINQSNISVKRERTHKEMLNLRITRTNNGKSKCEIRKDE